jgi:hypothetical protein
MHIEYRCPHALKDVYSHLKEPLPLSHVIILKGRLKKRKRFLIIKWEHEIS